jgi:hypothetical protein
VYRTRHRGGRRDPGDFERVEDRPAAVVADDHLHARRGFSAGRSRAPTSQQREITDHQARDAGDPTRLTRDRDAERRRDRAVDARETAVRVNGTFLPPSSSSATRTSRDDANTSRSCGQLARHAASTRAARSIGARATSSSAAIAPSRSRGTAEARPSASGAAG